MMYLLWAIRAFVAFALLWLIVTQIVFPLADGRKLFPAFRRNPLAKKVVETRDEVGSLKDQVENLDELVKLSQKKTRLSRKLESAEAALVPKPTPEAPPTSTVNSDINSSKE